MKKIPVQDNIIKGSISEMIDNVLDEEDYLNQEQLLRKTSDWKNTSFKIGELEDSKNQEIFQTAIQKSYKKNKEDKKEIKILNENLFKGKGFRTNKEEFLRQQEDLLNKSGISDISVLSTMPNVYSCAIPRPNTSRYKGAVKSNNININVKESYSKKMLKKI
jgi:hypothetical protein